MSQKLDNNNLEPKEEQPTSEAELLREPDIIDAVPQIMINVQDVLKDKSKNGLRYKDESRAICFALRSAGLSQKQIADSLKISKSTVHVWLNAVRQDDERFNDLVERIKTGLPNKAYFLANTVMSSINDDDIKKASLLQKTTAAGIMIDKARLIDGQSTENQAVWVKKDITIKTKVDNLEAKRLAIEADIQRLESK